MKKEWNVWRSTLMFLTRIPVGKDLPHDPELLQHTPKYFPLAGILIGTVGAFIFLLASFLFAIHFALLLSMSSTILLTGAFHEDGFADVCDAFGGGWTKEKILTIMKDSRLGTYGVTGLIFMLAAKFMLLDGFLNIDPYHLLAERITGTLPMHQAKHLVIPCMLIAGHSISRLMPVIIIQRYNYVTADDGSKSKPLASSKLPGSFFLVALASALLPLLFFKAIFMLVAIPILVAVAWLMRFFVKWIGGYTGDCLGASQQVAEIVFYASCLLIIKLIMLIHI